MTRPTPKLTRVSPIAEDLWAAEHDLFLPGGVHFRGRMTVVRFRTGELLLHSPIPIDDALASELSNLGPVAHIVAPNTVHHLHLSGAVKRYPDATLSAPGGLIAKRGDHRFQDLTDTSPEWSSELSPLHMTGTPRLDEVVFLHRPSRTLLVTDYFFNIHEAQGWLTPWVLRLTGTWRRFAQSRLWRWVNEDRALARQSAEQMLTWNFERIVPAHGRVLESAAHQHAETALEWLLGGAPKALPHAT
jgi:hypothetical protein